MPRRKLEGKSITKTVTNISSLANQCVVTRKPQSYDKSSVLYRPRLLERSDPYNQILWKNECDSVIDPRRIDYEPPACHSREHPKVSETQEKTTTKNTEDKEIAASMQKLSIGANNSPITRAAKMKTNFEPAPDARRSFHTLQISPAVWLVSYVRHNILAWTEEVFAEVGPDQKERKYQVAMKEFLKLKGFLVASEATLKFERAGSKPITKRADLILSMPDVPENILIECKAKKKLEKKDFEQVLFYEQHFGISECYIVNFSDDVLQVRRLNKKKKSKADYKRRPEPAATK